MLRTLRRLFPQSRRSGWSTHQVDGRTVDVFDPGTDDRPGVVLFLQGHAQIGLTDNRVYCQQLQDHGLVAVCPHGGRSWWLDRICPDFSAHITPLSWLRTVLVPWITGQWNIGPPRIALLGVSTGGQGALQLAYRHAREFPVVAAISPAVDFHQLYGRGLPIDHMYASQEEARQDTIVLNLHPLSWPRCQFLCCDPSDTDWFDGCTRLGMKLSSSGILYERDFETSAGGHSWEYFNAMAPRVFDHIVRGLRSVDDDASSTQSV